MNTLLFNPFLKIAGYRSMGIGSLILLATSCLGFLSGLHFDGVLDIHLGLRFLISYFILEGLASWFSISLVLVLAAKILSRSSTRIIDIVGTQALARYPFLIASLLGLIPIFQNLDMSSPFTIPFAIICMLIDIWYGVLVFNAVKISANLKGNKLVISFVIGLIAAEILSKYLIYLIYQF